MKKYITLITLIISFIHSYSNHKTNIYQFESFKYHNDSIITKKDTTTDKFSSLYSFKISNSTTEIKREKINLSDYYSFSDIIQNTNGFYANYLSSPGQVNSLFFQGNLPKNLTIMIDGIPYNNLFFGIPDQSLIMTEDIEKIEILSNSQSIITGNSKAINIITNKNNSSKPYTYVRHIEAPYDTYLTDGIFMQNISSRSNLMVGFNYQISDGRFKNSDFTFLGSRIRYRYLISNKIELNVSDYFTKNTRGINGGVKLSNNVLTEDNFNGDVANVVFPNDNEKYIRNLLNIQMAAYFLKDTINPTLLTVSFGNESYEINNDTLNNPIFELFNQNISTKSLILSIKQCMSFLNHNFTFYLYSNFNFTNDINLSTNQINSNLSKKINSNELNFSIIDNLNVSKNFDINLFLQYYLPDKKYSYNQKNRMSFSINPILNVGPFLFSLEYVNAYKSNNLYEKFIKKDLIKNLDPEKHIGINFNTKYIQKNTEINFNIFYNKISSILLAGNFINDHPVSSKFINFIDTQSQGFSLNCNINFGKILYESKIDYIHYKNDLLERIIPELTTYAGIYYYDNIFTKDITIKAGINGKYFSRVSNFFDKLVYTDIKNINYFNYDPKGILNLFAVLNLQTASIYLGIDNILDHNYFITYIYPQNDRTFKLAVSWAFWD